MCVIKLGAHVFSKADIESFAEASGDFNPIHVDPIGARRLITGGQTVHGMHTVLFVLNLYYQVRSHVPNQIRVFLQKPILEGEFVEFFCDSQSNETHVTARTAYGQVVSILLIGAGKAVTTPINSKRPAKKRARNCSFAEIKGKCGTLSIMAAREDIDREFPFANKMLGTHIVASIMAFSRLVGMSTPGLHSIFTGLEIKFGEQCGCRLGWRVSRHISPKVPIKITLEAQDFYAELSSFYRPAQVSQPSIRDVKRVIEPKVFSDQRALVLGGSRGLGELVAKCLAVGGARVHITYARGKSDAEKVQKSINRIGGSCAISKLNVENIDSAYRLLKLIKPTHIYFFPSPSIRHNTHRYNTALFSEYYSIYVTAFCELVRAAAKSIQHPFYIFYPSTVFIETEPKGFAEYINAKLAGERHADLLAAEYINVNIIKERLPPLRTDQTISLTAGEAEPALEMLSGVLLAMRTSYDE